jgi:hypothetical protein
MKTDHFFVIIILILNLLAFGILPPSEYTHTRTTVSVENQDFSEILHIANEYFPPSLSSAIVEFKFRPRIPSWLNFQFFRPLQRTHLTTDPFLSKVLLPPPAILNEVSTTILRC